MRNSSLAATLPGRHFHDLTSHHPGHHPGHHPAQHHLTRQRRAEAWRAGLTRGAVSLSAMAAAVLAAALAFPGPAQAEASRAEPGAATAAFSLAAAAPTPIGPRFDPGAAPHEQDGNALTRLASAAAAPAPLRLAVRNLRVESADEGVMAAWHLSDYDLRLEYGTVFYRTAAVPYQRADGQLLRPRLMSRVVTRF